MPRTKMVRTKKKDPEFVNVIAPLINKLRETANEELKQQVTLLEDMKNDILFQINMAKKQINHTIANKTIAELKAPVSVYSSLFESFAGESIKENTQNKKKVQSKARLKRSLSYTEDEGYLTAGSNDSKTMSRNSRSRSRAPQQKSSRLSRSLSRSKVQHQPLNTYRTPACKGNAPLTFGTITPKVKPNTPQVILRRPKQGEVALSLQGSPLMVNTVVSDQIANVNIPLPDGRLLSLQPERGLRISQIPMLNEQTQQQIQALRDNLNKVCASAAMKRK